MKTPEPGRSTERWPEQPGIGLGKPKPRELNLARVIKGNKRSFYRYISDED